MLASVTAVCGCGDVEWNWDNSFWDRPTRVVKPSPRPQADGADHPGQPPSADNAVTQGPKSPARSDTGSGAGRTRPGDAGGASSDGAVPASAGRSARPFYNLYLVPADVAASDAPRNETRVRLDHASPQSCARILEMLYVPLGRSGSHEETYLIFEQREEFEKALQFATLLDVPPPGAEDSATNPGLDAWQHAVGEWYAIVEAGAVVDDGRVSAAEKEFAAIAIGSKFDPLQRWAAGVFAGRLAAGYRYDFEAARGHYATARNHVPPESVEEMTAFWWRADTFIQEGRTRDAREAYEDILDAYTHLFPRSHIVARSYAIMKKQKK